MISFNIPPFYGTEIDYIKDAISTGKISGDGKYTKLCNGRLKERLALNEVMLTTSCTHALEMASQLCDIKPGDEVIMPSYTFVSTADAFVLRGAKIVFVDIRPDTMNIDENKIEEAITSKTKAIVPVHYAGVSCEMDKILEIAKAHNLYVVEDAAQGVMSTYKGKYLGGIGDMGCYSFHETKNYSMGEGGALVVKDPEKTKLAEIIREKGTNRTQFFRGEVDKYTWIEQGSSYLPSDINAAYLWAQLEHIDEMFDDRMSSWNYYYQGLEDLKDKGVIDLPIIPEECGHNAHMFYIKVSDLDERTRCINYLRDKGVYSVFHYVPLHSSPAGLKYGRFSGEDKYTTSESDRLIRLPMYYKLSTEDKNTVIDAVHSFFN